MAGLYRCRCHNDIRNIVLENSSAGPVLIGHGVPRKESAGRLAFATGFEAKHQLSPGCVARDEVISFGLPTRMSDCSMVPPLLDAVSNMSRVPFHSWPDSQSHSALCGAAMCTGLSR